MDTARQKFTGYEREADIGLDYAHARYYSSGQGRFTSVDPYNVVMEAQATATSDTDKARRKLVNYLSRPQEWNRYAYVANNPLRYVDPDGQKLRIFGSMAAYFLADLEALSGLDLDVDKQGNVTVVGTPDPAKLTSEGKRILEIIKDPTYTLIVGAIDSNNPNEKHRDVFIGRAAKVTLPNSGGFVVDYADINQFSSASQGSTPLTIVLHEVEEGWTRLTNPNAGDLETAHRLAIAAENRYRQRLGLPKRGAEGVLIVGEPCGFLIPGVTVIDYDTHTEYIDWDLNDPNVVTRVQVEKKNR